MAQPQEQAIASIAAILSQVSGYKSYIVDPSFDIADKGTEKLSSNDTLTFVDDDLSIITNYSSKKLIQSLPLLAKKESSKIYNLNVKISNDDFSAVAAVKDLGFDVLISTHIRETIDFTILASLLSKTSKRSTIHFYVESSESYDITYYTLSNIKKAYDSFESTELHDCFDTLKSIVGIQYSEFDLIHTAPNTKNLVILLGNPAQFAINSNFKANNSLISVKVYRPFKLQKLESLIKSIRFEKLIILEQSSINLQFQTLFLDLIELLPALSTSNIEVLPLQLLKVDSDNVEQVVISINNLSSSSSPILGKSFNDHSGASLEKFAKSSDGAYLNILRETTDEKFLNILNDFQVNPSPDYSLGKFLSQEEHLQKLITLVESNLSSFTGDLNDELANWLIDRKSVV